MILNYKKEIDAQYDLNLDALTNFVIDSYPYIKHPGLIDLWLDNILTFLDNFGFKDYECLFENQITMISKAVENRLDIYLNSLSTETNG